MSWLAEHIFFTTCLGAYLDRKLLLQLLDGRCFIGMMRSFDGYGSIVLQDAFERIVVGNLYCDQPMGVWLGRAENVILIGEPDTRLPELPPHMTAVSLHEIKLAKKAEIDSSRLKITLKKWIEELLDDM